MQTSITTWLKNPAAVKEAINTSVTQDCISPNTPKDPSAPSPTDQHGTTSPSPPHHPHQPTLTAQPLPPTTLPFANPGSPLVANISLVPCSPTNVSSFERLNTLLLPIPYPQSFYRETLSDPTSNHLTVLATWHDNPACTATPGKVMAAIRCRILPDPSTNASPKDRILYISTLGVLSPYRGFGVATHLLRAVVERGITEYGVSAVGAHVWEASLDAREWYVKRGFRETHLEERYYRRLTPQGAYVLRREIGPRDLLHFGRG